MTSPTARGAGGEPLASRVWKAAEGREAADIVGVDGVSGDGGDEADQAQAGHTSNEGLAKNGVGGSSIGAAWTAVAKGEHRIAAAEIQHMKRAYSEFISPPARFDLCKQGLSDCNKEPQPSADPRAVVQAGSYGVV
jgi:hypothetical protein